MPTQAKFGALLSRCPANAGSCRRDRGGIRTPANVSRQTEAFVESPRHASRQAEPRSSRILVRPLAETFRLRPVPGPGGPGSAAAFRGVN